MGQTLEKRNHHKKYLLIAIASVIAIAGIFHIWLHITNPYASWNIVKQPYTTNIKDGEIQATKHFSLNAYAGPIAQATGYYKSGFLIVQNAYFGSYPAPSATPEGIISDIHKLRFDPSKPYLISGDQFSVLYPRNLGVFYNSLLDPNTAHDQQDWENRQRIYLQSVLYAIDAFSSANTLTTTIVPFGTQSALLTEVHPGSVPSDTLYGMLYALDTLQDETRYPQSSYKLQTSQTVHTIVSERRDDLKKLVEVYLDQVRDPSTGLIKKSAHLAAARDGVTRESSFYDNIVLWKTLEIANRLGIYNTPTEQLETKRSQILATYWDEEEGHFKDDLREHTAKTNYSSDWLLALPTGFLSIDRTEDKERIEKSIAFIRSEGIAKPFPIKYQATLEAKDVPWAVKTFVPNYGGDAIWSYWGAQYITLLADLYKSTQNEGYLSEAKAAIQTYNEKMIETHGFPETFTPSGQFLQNGVYKSIRQTGWVVQFETAVQKVTAL